MQKAVPTFLYISEGRKHEAGMLRESVMIPMLQNNAISPTGQQLCVYGDPARDPLRVHLFSTGGQVHSPNVCLQQKYG